MEWTTAAATAYQLDQADELRAYREQFYMPRDKDGREKIYFLGNSLGLQPHTAEAGVQDILADWREKAIDGYFEGNNPWLTYNEELCKPYAAIIGALPDEIVAMNTLTVNLHLMMVSFYRPEKTRYKIIMEAGAFPSDQYVVKSQLAFHGFDPDEALIELTPRAGEHTLRDEDILAAIDREGPSVALIMLGGVNYYTGQLFDMAAITAAGHKQGCVVGFDLAHAAGNVTLMLHEWDVDFACWCSYKYLNGGPASIAAAFVHERHHAREDLPRFAGWWGHEQATRFLMGPDFKASVGAAGWQLSNAPLLSLAPVKASLEIFTAAGMKMLQEKSRCLTGYLEYLLDALGSDKFTIITPREPERRGCQLSLIVHDNGKAVHKALMKDGVVCDWREPASIRVAPVPLYNSFTDVYNFVRIFAQHIGAHSTAKKQAF